MARKYNVNYKISYKVYLNERLKKVSFHGEETYPLYIRVSYKGQTIFFKSYYFGLFSAEYYISGLGSDRKRPLLSDIIAMEEQLLEFIVIQQSIDGRFDLDTFKEFYILYGSDLCEGLAELFTINLITFFTMRDMTSVGWSFHLGRRQEGLYPVLQQMRRALKGNLYRELISGSTYARLYLPLYKFVLHIKKAPYYYLSYREWTLEVTRDAFRDFVRERYPKSAIQLMLDMVKFLEPYLGKELQLRGKSSFPDE